jgi:hypothetical protein
MTPVNPQWKTTLILNSHYQPAGFLSARAVIRHLINGSVKGFDANGNCYGWKSEVEKAPSWESGNISLYHEHPCLRGGMKAYAIPTVVILQSSFGMKKMKNQFVSLRKLFSHYRGTCQYCLEKIPYSQATEDHWYPKEKGGSNHDFNLVLACKSCNSKKANHFPFLNVLGKPVKPKPICSHVVIVPDGVDVRAEWRPYLYMEPTSV